MIWKQFTSWEMRSQKYKTSVENDNISKRLDVEKVVDEGRLGVRTRMRGECLKELVNWVDAQNFFTMQEEVRVKYTSIEDTVGCPLGRLSRRDGSRVPKARACLAVKQPGLPESNLTPRLPMLGRYLYDLGAIS